MPDRLRIALAVLAGLVVGSVVNMAIVKLGPMVIPPPPGADMSSAEGLKAAMPLLEPKHFIPPFLAHALGTFFGALTGVRIAVARRAMVAYIIGALFLAGGIAASLMIPAPTWFIALDLLIAYLPMAWLALRIGDRNPTR